MSVEPYFLASGSCRYQQIRLPTGSTVLCFVYPIDKIVFSTGLTVRQTSTQITENTLSIKRSSDTYRGRSLTWSVGFTFSQKHLNIIWVNAFSLQNDVLVFDSTRVLVLGDELLLQQILFDAIITAPLEAYWNSVMLNDRSDPWNWTSCELTTGL